MTHRSCLFLSASALALCIVAAAPRAQASGFQLREQGASGQGLAYAGITAGGSDISSMFYNPAALTRYEGQQFQLGFTSIQPSAVISGAAGSRSLVPSASSLSAVSGSSSHGNAARSALTPNLYAMWSLSPDLKLGLSVNVPYGLTTQYDDTWVGRYHALRSHLMTLDITPTVAYRFNSHWSGGVSFVARQAKAELSQALDLGYEAYASLQVAPFTAISNVNPSTQGPVVYPGAADGAVSVTGDSWAYGFKAGVLYEPCASLRVGLGYQSAIKEKVKGDAVFTVPSSVAQGMAALAQLNPTQTALLGALGKAFAAGTTNASVSAELNLPAVITFGASYDVSSTFSLALEVDSTQWSKFKELRLKFPDPTTQADNVTNENWKDSTFVSVGASCHPGNGWTYRVGLALDKAPMDDSTRTPRIPDSDRTWGSCGVGYQFTKGFGVDLGYTHIFAKDCTLNLQGGSNPASSDFFKGNLTGTYKNSIDICAVQARWAF